MRTASSVGRAGATWLVWIAIGGGCNAVLDNPPGQLATENDGGAVDAGDASLPNPPAPIEDSGNATIDANPLPAIDSGSVVPPFDAGTIPTCPLGDKLCNGGCASVVDPLYGCDPTACEACALAHATPTCGAGGCAVGQCESGYADCDQNPTNGCETDLSQPTHCGACNAKCSTTAPDCAPTTGGFACSTGCSGGAPTLCGKQCVSLAVSLDNCGACGHACLAVANGQATCNGQCGFVCAADFHACGAGCASDVSTATCGGSCSPCATGPNAVPTCDGAHCGLACQPHFGNCNGATGDGCEVDLRTSGANCGACGVSCDGGTCANGTCSSPPPPPPPDSGSTEDSSAPPDDAGDDATASGDASTD